MTTPLARKSAPATSSTQAADFYGERNTGIRMVSTGKLDDAAEEARKNLIKSMGKKPRNSVTDRWKPKEEPTQEQLIGSDKKIRNSYSAYEQRRNSRIVEQTELLKKVQKEQEEKEAERMARIEKRRNERLSSIGGVGEPDLADGLKDLKIGAGLSSSIPASRKTAPAPASLHETSNFPRLSHR